MIEDRHDKSNHATIPDFATFLFQQKKPEHPK
jgi:hypothetical protein